MFSFLPLLTVYFVVAERPETNNLQIMNDVITDENDLLADSTSKKNAWMRDVNTLEIDEVILQDQMEINSELVERMNKLESRIEEVEADQSNHVKISTPNKDAGIAQDGYVDGGMVKRFGGGYSSNCVPKKLSKCRVMPFRGRKWKFCTYKLGTKCSSVDR